MVYDSCLDYSLAVMFIYFTSAVENNVWYSVNPDYIAFMVIVVMLSHHILFCFSLYINYICQISMALCVDDS
jgi:hypothetical protein